MKKINQAALFQNTKLSAVVAFALLSVNCIIAQPSTNEVAVNSQAISNRINEIKAKINKQGASQQAITFTADEQKILDDIRQKEFLKLPQIPISVGVSVRGKYCRIGVGGRTNVIAFKPLQTQVFDAKLLDPSGKSVSKTFWARWNVGQELVPDIKLKDGSYQQHLAEFFGHSRKLLFGAVNDGIGGECAPILLDELDVLKIFRIKEPGEYRLQVQVRLFTKDTNGVFQPFILPIVETKVNISESDLGQ